MKKRVYILVAILIILLIFLAIIGIRQAYLIEKTKYDFRIETNETLSCSGVYELSYELSNSINLYTYCLEDIKIYELDCKSDDCSKSLSEFIKEQGSSIMNKIYEYMDNVKILEDGKTKIYTSNKGKFTNNDLKIITCNTEENNDIFIGPLSMEDNICEK